MLYRSVSNGVDTYFTRENSGKRESRKEKEEEEEEEERRKRRGQTEKMESINDMEIIEKICWNAKISSLKPLNEIKLANFVFSF